jgi:transposase
MGSGTAGAEHTDDYGHSRFCELYRAWCKTISQSMRQMHAAGEKLFVDFAGDTVAVRRREWYGAARPYLRRVLGRPTEA